MNVGMSRLTLTLSGERPAVIAPRRIRSTARRYRSFVHKYSMRPSAWRPAASHVSSAMAAQWIGTVREAGRGGRSPGSPVPASAARTVSVVSRSA
jgi:hypothetical protein